MAGVKATAVPKGKATRTRRKGGGMRLAIFRSTDPAAIRYKIMHSEVDANRLVQSARDALGLTVSEVSKLIDASPRTIERRLAAAKPLDVAEADRAYRLARIYDLAVELIGDDAKAAHWLRTPHRYLGNETPLTMLETEVGTYAVEQSLYAIAYGGVA